MNFFLLLILLISCVGVYCHDTHKYSVSSSSSSSYATAYSSSSSCEKKVTKRCRRNERYVKCPATMCIAQNCTELGYPIPCPYVGPRRRCPVQPGCICIEGYLRDHRGICIPKKHCPSCAGDVNAEAGCGFLCGEHCSCDIEVPDPCPCDRNGCQCRKGFVYDDNINKCVKPNQCSEEESNDNSIQPVQCADDVLPSLLKGNNMFTNKFLYEAHTKTPTKSQIMSPFSVFIPIAELALYAESDTYTQLMNVLNLRSKDEIRCVFPALTKQMKAEQNIVLNLAARIFATDVHPLTDEFLEDTKNVFGAEAESLNFTDSEGSAKRVNEWVEKETNDRIKDIAAPSMFNSDTRLILANAIYFLGNWVNQFNVNNTENRDFNVDKNTVIQIPTMYQNERFNYAEVQDLDCKVLEMFYKGGNFSFVILLPNEIEGITSLIEKIQEPDALLKAYNSTASQKVDVYLPKIKTESEFDLSVILKAANVTDLFDGGLSKLNNILKQYETLYVSAAKQKAFVEVDEKGTEAAAANIFGLAGGSAAPPKIYEFKADRPFVFYIFYSQTPIFCGTFVNVS